VRRLGLVTIAGGSALWGLASGAGLASSLWPAAALIAVAGAADSVSGVCRSVINQNRHNRMHCGGRIGPRLLASS